MAEKLHQHLAAKKEVEQGYEKIKQETLKVFKTSDKVEGLQKDYTPFDDAGQKVPPEKKEVVTTVPDRLRWFWNHATALIDFRATSDATNCEAKAKLEFGGVDFGELPTTFLLALEKQLEELRAIYDSVPTLDMTRDWKASSRKDIFQHGPLDSFKSTKKTTAVVLYEATKEHPAQIKEVTEDIQIGRFSTTYFSGAVSPQDKADWLQRIDNFIVAVKKARMKANEVEIVDIVVGEKIFQAIHG